MEAPEVFIAGQFKALCYLVCLIFLVGEIGIFLQNLIYIQHFSLVETNLQQIVSIIQIL